jgi:hypothetical protein
VQATRRDSSAGSITVHRLTSFFGACEVSCRVRAEREKPYALTSSRENDSPRDQLGRNIGSPATRAMRGSASWLYLVVLAGVYAYLGALSTVLPFISEMMLRPLAYISCTLLTPLFTDLPRGLIFSETYTVEGFAPRSEKRVLAEAVRG